MAAEKIFERVNDEHDRRDFQDPECGQRDRVGDKKLDHRGHQKGGERAQIRDGVRRECQVFAKIKEDERHRRDRDGGKDEPAAQENAETISEIIQRLDQERIDLALANVAGDLPFVFGGRDEIRDDDREKVIVNHRTVVVAVHAAAGFLENGAPEKDGAGQRD